MVNGPLSRRRRICASSKRLIDRVIRAHGQDGGPQRVLFRPYGWIGRGPCAIDSAKDGGDRAVTRLPGHLLRRESILLVDGGSRRRP